MKHRPFSLLLSFLMASGYATASNIDPYWSDTAINKEVKSSLKLMPDQYRLIHLNEIALKDHFNTVILSKNLNDQSMATRSLRVPLPDGQSLTIKLVETKVMAPALAAKFPQIKTYRVDANDNNGISGTVDFGEQGFHAMLFMKDGSRLFIDPRKAESGSDAFYISYYDKNYHPANKEPFQCKIKTHYHPLENRSSRARTAQRISPYLKTYRLAIATTSQYTNYHGGKVKAMSAVVTTVNRVNSIYRRDLGIELQLVDNNDLLIHTDPKAYDHSDLDLILRQNQVKVDSIIGNDNYDVAHVMSTGSGGIASLGSVCGGNVKAEGYTASENPIGDAFDVDFVAHEIGHQFGGTHTFNAQTENCRGDNRASGNAYEPGSGSTIMAYAGICGENNLQDNSDAMFHISSIVQISDYIGEGHGSECGVRSSTVNQQPFSMAGKDYVIPANTAFELEGKGTDPDKDTLTYSWEQIDSGRASDVDVVEVDNAIFRVFLPVSEPIRIFPKLSNLLTNTQSLGESLPDIPRELNFSLVVRDGKGGVAADEMKVTVASSDKFSITSHNTYGQLTIRAGQMTNVTWNVANTNSTPISCSHVDISLSTDAKHHFSSVLASNIVNDGNEIVRIPDNIDQSDIARIKIKCSDNIFFDISDVDLKTESLMNALTPIITNMGRNQVVDPGDTIQLTIPLQNTGSRSITNVSSSITSMGKGIRILQSDSPYAVIEPSSTINNSYVFELAVPANYSCGTDIPITMKTNFTLNSSSRKEFEFLIPTGVSRQKSKSIDVSKAIPDNQSTGISSQLTISNAVLISDGNFSIDVDIDHVYRGDMILTLISPKGTSILLKQVSNSDYDADVKGNFPQSLVPFESLQRLDGEDANGVWTLKVDDGGKGDSGILNGWGIHYATANCFINNELPVAVNSQLTVKTDQEVESKLQASDVNHDSLTYQLVGNPTKGTISHFSTSTGEFTYTPRKGKMGDDGFSFRVFDGVGYSNIAVVNVAISVPNNAPIAENDSSIVTQEQSIMINVLRNDSDVDGDTLSLIKISQPAYGSTKVVGSQVVYTSSSNFSGTDYFTYTLSDGKGNRSIAMVSVIVEAAYGNDLAKNPSKTSEEEGAGGGFSWYLLAFLFLLGVMVKAQPPQLARLKLKN